MISLLIPTYNRPGYLKRILGYYSDYRVPYNIIVADGSSDEVKQVNEQTVHSFPILKIRHLHKYSSETHHFLRIEDALKSVVTEYCVLCADDDFITPNGINQSLDFLDKNRDFAVAHGRYIFFYFDQGGKRQFKWNPAYSCESITFTDPAVRLSHHLSNYLTPTFYSVHRTDLLQMIWAENTRSGNGMILSELLLSMLALIHGKMKCLDVLYSAREKELNERISWLTPADAIKSGKYDQEYTRFRICLATHLSEQAQLDMEASGKFIDDAMSAYMKKYFLSDVIPTRSSKKKILDSLSLPNWIERGVTNSITWGAVRIREIYNAVSILKYRGDFNRIRLHVLSSLK
jgi:glycosyltransferase domain-containing protein